MSEAEQHARLAGAMRTGFVGTGEIAEPMEREKYAFAPERKFFLRGDRTVPRLVSGLEGDSR